MLWYVSDGCNYFGVNSPVTCWKYLYVFFLNMFFLFYYQAEYDLRIHGYKNQLVKHHIFPRHIVHIATNEGYRSNPPKCIDTMCNYYLLLLRWSRHNYMYMLYSNVSICINMCFNIVLQHIRVHIYSSSQIYPGWSRNKSNHCIPGLENLIALAHT